MQIPPSGSTDCATSSVLKSRSGPCYLCVFFVNFTQQNVENFNFRPNITEQLFTAGNERNFFRKCEHNSSYSNMKCIHVHKRLNKLHPSQSISRMIKSGKKRWDAYAACIWRRYVHSEFLWGNLRKRYTFIT